MVALIAWPLYNHRLFELELSVLNQKYSTVNKVLLLQLLLVSLVGICFIFFKSSEYAIWSILGGLVAFIPNAYFALKIRNSYEQEAGKFVKAFYLGETGKLLLTGLMFTLIFQLQDVKLLPLMTGYVSALSVFWLALILRDQNFK